MPPKVKYTKEEIGDAAYSLVREEGIEALSARSLANSLGISTAPIFTAYRNIDEVKEYVIDKAKEKYQEYSERGLGEKIAFKGAGMEYIKFAKDEPRLFKLLFMTYPIKNRFYIPEGSYNESKIKGIVESEYGMSEPVAMRIYNHMSVYTHGLAVFFAEGQCDFSDEEVSRMLSEEFFAMRNYLKE